MTRLPLAIALAAAAILGPSLATSATAADGRGYGSDDGNFEYSPYSDQENGGRGYARTPDGAQGEDDGDDDATGRDYEGPAAGSDDGPDDGPAEPGDAQRYSHDEDADADAPEGRDGHGEDSYERAAPPRAEVPSPADDFEGSLPRIEVRASAPDGRVPAEVREQDARRAAIEAWRAKVSERYGQDFAHWRMAEGKRVECAGEGRNGVACTASAVPMYGFGRYGEWQRRGRD